MRDINQQLLTYLLPYNKCIITDKIFFKNKIPIPSAK